MNSSGAYIPRFRNALEKFVIGIMQAAQIPISIFPFWYKTVVSDRNHYRPFLQQWRNDKSFYDVWDRERFNTVAFADTAYILFSLARMACVHPGEVWECGVYKGGTAKLLAVARDSVGPFEEPRTIRLFDTFQGMPERRPDTDSYEIGSFGDTSIDAVKFKLDRHQDISFHQGLIPQSFAGLEDRAICFAHIDVDQYGATQQCCNFILPRLTRGGIMVIDDYGRPSTIGARMGADAVLGALNITPLVLSTGQGIIIK